MRSELVPTGAVAMRLCRYGKLRERRKLRGATLITASSLLGRLTSEFDALPEPNLDEKCPIDLGGEIVDEISYGSTRRLVVTVSLGGCELVSNGLLTRSGSGFGTATPEPKLVGELRRLV